MINSENGSLVPVGGGDVIPLIRDTLTVGRRDSCDIPLPFPNVSGLHCELQFKDGVWSIRDMGSTNGIKVNGSRVQKKVLHPGDTITIGKRNFTIEYSLTIGKQALAEMLEDEADNLTEMSLLQKAGLAKLEEERPTAKKPRDYRSLEEED
jgi:pSer/pThr/pTyr-binding forkhead associated (FHA) protein